MWQRNLHKVFYIFTGTYKKLICKLIEHIAGKVWSKFGADEIFCKCPYSMPHIIFNVALQAVVRNFYVILIALFG